MSRSAPGPRFVAPALPFMAPTLAPISATTLVLILALLTSGCASLGPGAGELLAPFPEPARVESVAFFPQTELHCGPAALASMLDHSGLSIDYPSLVERVYLPGRGGTLQVELMAASRSLNRIPWVLPEDAGAVLEEVAAGRPVLVLENQGLARVPFWHYAVVIGFDPLARSVIQHSGTEAELARPIRRWLRDWNLAGRWALLTLPPDQLPLRAERERWLQTLADFEAVAEADAALSAWQTASQRWPDASLAWIGQGNSHYRLGDIDSAIQAFEQALVLAPEQPAAAFNLALLLLEQGQACRAADQLKALKSRPGLEQRAASAWSRARQDCLAQHQPDRAD